MFLCHFWCLPPVCTSIEIARNVILMGTDYDLDIIIMDMSFFFWPAPIFRSVWRGTKAKRMWSRSGGIPKVDNLNFYWNLIECATRKTKSRETRKLSHNISRYNSNVYCKWPWAHGGRIAWLIPNETLHTSNSNECTRRMSCILLRSIFANAIYFFSLFWRLGNLRWQ